MMARAFQHSPDDKNGNRPIAKNGRTGYSLVVDRSCIPIPASYVPGWMGDQLGTFFCAANCLPALGLVS